MTADVTKDWIAFMGTGAMRERDDEPMKFDLFEDAAWRRKVSGPTADGTVTVTLSTGKSVTVNTKFLGFLRVLAEELAKDDPRLN
ncbi:MAG: hypothetical protein K2X34_04790 [Hyphomonadaceae bacterium]|nr:hypothetical protein [Hyphomonadaceae bacterium]